MVVYVKIGSFWAFDADSVKFFHAILLNRDGWVFSLTGSFLEDIPTVARRAAFCFNIQILAVGICLDADVLAVKIEAFWAFQAFGVTIEFFTINIIARLALVIDADVFLESEATVTVDTSQHCVVEILAKGVYLDTNIFQVEIEAFRAFYTDWVFEFFAVWIVQFIGSDCANWVVESISWEAAEANSVGFVKSLAGRVNVDTISFFIHVGVSGALDTNWPIEFCAIGHSWGGIIHDACVVGKFVASVAFVTDLILIIKSSA